jgi:hypothetical protein
LGRSCRAVRLGVARRGKSDSIRHGYANAEINANSTMKSNLIACFMILRAAPGDLRGGMKMSAIHYPTSGKNQEETMDARDLRVARKKALITKSRITSPNDGQGRSWCEAGR